MSGKRLGRKVDERPKRAIVLCAACLREHLVFFPKPYYSAEVFSYGLTNWK